MEEVWRIAAQERCAAFLQQRGRTTVEDDHLALNNVGIPAIDIIDFKYPHWHKLTDLPENCSADSMAQVARVLITWLERVK